jgi:uncharacterized protein (TIGR02147 family)
MESTLASAIFEFDDYKTYVLDWVKQQPHGGHGQYRRMAAQMRVHSTLLSHVFRGSKELTSEQACALASFLKLGELDTDYLLALVEQNRAGSRELKAAVARRLFQLKERHSQLEHRVPGARTLSGEERTVFYSQWYYSAVRLAASLPGMLDAESIAGRLGVPRELVRDALAFLLGAGLLKQQGNGYQLAAKRTHLGAASPLAAAHHRNWRVQAMSRYEKMAPRDFAFTSPMTLSQKDAARVRELLVDVVAKVAKLVEPSECESLRLLNIDWLEV